MGWTHERGEYIKQELKTKHLIVLTECGGKILSHGGPDLIVGDKPVRGDPAGTAAIALSTQAQKTVLNHGHKGSRLVWVRLQETFKTVFVVGAYIPHGGRVSPSREDTLQQLDDLIKKETTKGECVIVLGDLNSKLPRGVKGLTGKFSIHPRADEGGQRIMEIMQANNLFAASTSFAPAKSAPLGQATYRPKNKNQKPAQLDYCLISNRWKSSARSCKVEWRHSIHRHLRLYDHGMVVVKFSLKIKSKQAARTGRRLT
jgi:exonuclease III